MKKIKLSMPVIVEGKYDKAKLKSIIDGIIITTDGFGIYKNPQKTALIRQYAEKTGVIILTDSDGAGFQIRSRLKSCISTGKVVNIYIPDVFGKEKRKAQPSKEGKLGVEGINADILLKAFADAGVIEGGSEKKPPQKQLFDMARLAADGLSGGENSSQKRKKLCKLLRLPERISSKGLIEALNTLYTEEDYLKALEKIHDL